MNEKKVIKTQVPVKPVTVTDTYREPKRYELGKMPTGGFQAVWHFEKDNNIINQYTTKVNKK